jgi:hypothetical protein
MLNLIWLYVLASVCLLPIMLFLLEYFFDKKPREGIDYTLINLRKYYESFERSGVRIIRIPK